MSGGDPEPPPGPARRRREILLRPAFARFWIASTASSLGSSVTSVAVPVLVVTILRATPLEVGFVNAAPVAGYTLLGFAAGAYLDRWRRRPVLIWSSLLSAAALGTIPVLWVAHALTIVTVVAVLLVFSAASVFGSAARQSYLVVIAERSELVAANARLDQSSAAAQTIGPAIGGGLVALLGAPVSVLVDALSYLVDAALMATMPAEQRPAPIEGQPRRRLGREIREGFRWIYSHRLLAPLAWSTHVWFVGNRAAMTILIPFVLRTLHLSALAYGLLLGLLGAMTLVGALAAAWLGRRFGEGPVVTSARIAYAVLWAVVAVAPLAGALAALPLFAGLGLYGLALGVENANEMGFWQAVTPDRLQGRTNTTRRSANRTGAFIGALLGGALATVAGVVAGLWVCVGLCTLAALLVLLSPFRTARATAR